MMSATLGIPSNRSMPSGLADGGVFFGPDRWVEDVAEGAQHWRLVGLDVVLMGSGEPAEAILYGTI
jgi:hypothetical protein